MNKKQVMIASRLYEAQETAKSLLGDAYPDRIGIVLKHLRVLARKHNTSVINAALNVAKTIDEPYHLMLVFAAVVEDAEGTA